MKKIVPLTALFVVSLCFAASAFGVCEGDHGGSLLRNYDGTIGDRYHVRMTMTFSGNVITGMYCYASQLKSISLRGRIMDGSRFVMDEFDASNRMTGHFEGEFPEKDPRARFGDSKLQCEVMIGWWSGVGNASERIPFYLSLESATGGTFKSRYSVAGAADDGPVERNVERFWKAVQRGDKTTVAALVRYPITVHTAKGNRKIHNAEALVRNYDLVFTPRYVEAIAKAIPKYMFVRDEGIMLGSGEVWFGSDGRVITLNNF